MCVFHQPRTNMSTDIITSSLERLESLFDQYAAGNTTPSDLGVRFQEYRQTIVQDIRRIHVKLKELLLEESNLVYLDDANVEYTFFGDFHGSLSDIVLVRSKFWKDRQTLGTNHYMFLGDYVDRGVHSLEVSLYLILLKLKHPDNFTILRGNHEVQSVNKDFLEECQTKVGQEDGEEMWRVFNQCFSLFPLAAIVTRRVFCCHGGIPKGRNILHRISHLKKGKLEEDSLMGEQLLWNDFYSTEDSSTKSLRLRVASTTNSSSTNEPQMFHQNRYRSVGYIVGRRAVDEFLKTYNLECIIRAHQFMLVEKRGYHINFNETVYTVFSNSSYRIICMGDRRLARNNTACARLAPGQRSVQIIPLVGDANRDTIHKSETFESDDIVALKYGDN